VDVCPLLCLAEEDPLRARAVRAAHRAAGSHGLSWYVCFVPERPNTHLRSPLWEGVALGWSAFLLRTDGILRWACCLWNADPPRRFGLEPVLRGCASANEPEWPAGDTFVFLPGAHGGVVETLRSEALRQAAEDFALLAAVEAALPEAEAEAAVRGAAAEIFGEALVMGWTLKRGGFCAKTAFQPERWKGRGSGEALAALERARRRLLRSLAAVERAEGTKA
jgi:hypothetical protein